jgi:hypothetical protein
MDIKINTGTLTQAIAVCEIAARIREFSKSLEAQITSLVKAFVDHSPTPQKTCDLENLLFGHLRKFGRQLIQWVSSRMEPGVEEMPATVTVRQRSHRRLPDKTLRSDIVTRFGRIPLRRGRYRLGRAGGTTFSLEILRSGNQSAYAFQSTH